MSTKKNCKYSKDDLRRALDAIKNGTPCLAAAKQYNVPRTTLIGKIKGIYPEECRSGAPSVLTVNEENLLVQWLINMGRMGFPVTKDQFLDSVSLLIKNLKRSNNFTDGRPGRHWYELFTKRHPDISERIAQNLCASRAAVTENKIRNWHKEIEEYFISNKINITDPKRIFNTDESAFFLSPKGRKVLAKKGSKSLHNRSGDDKECLTVLITGNAAGQLAPPMVMYAYERIPKHIVSQVPKGWGIGKSTSGWMTSESFFEFITNIFYPWLLSESIEFPVILYLDGHKSHVTLPLTDFCREKEIIVISLLPNSTHILQPLDVGLFKSLKMKWKSEVHNFKTQNNYKHLSKENCASVLQNALKSISNLENIFKNSFKVCGLYPFNADNIDYHKLLTEDNNELNKTKEAMDPEIVSHLRYLESYVQPDFLNKCYELMGADWTGEIKDKSLYDIWYKMYQKSGLSQDKEKTQNIIIDIEEGLILEDGWENLVEFEADNTISEDIFVEGKNTETEVELVGLEEDANKENIIENKKSIDVTAKKEIDKATKTNVVKKNIVKILENIKLTPEKRTDMIDQEQLREESVNKTKKDIKEILEIIQLTPEKQTDIIKDDQLREQSVNKTEENIEEILENIQLTPEKRTDMIEQEGVREESVNKAENNKEEILENIQLTPQKRTDIIENEQIREESVNKAKNVDKHSRVLPGVIIPSPFKNSLFWPEPTKKVTSRKIRVKIPSVGTSDNWREYYLKKEEEQKKAIQEKEDRKRKREENKKLRQEKVKKPRKKLIRQNKQKNTEEEDGSDSEEVSILDNDETENEEIEDEGNKQLYVFSLILLFKYLTGNGEVESTFVNHIKIGDFVIVSYFNDFYPAQITNKNSEKVLANAMAKAGGWWKWPNVKDEIWYDNHEVVKKIKPPVEINKRGFFAVKELEKHM